jgi:hypothetical protein
MVLAGQTVFIAGPPEVVDEEQSARNFADAAIQTKLAEQSDALEGKSGSLLWAVSTRDGKRLAEHKIDSLPVWDGTAAAHQRLYLATTNGQIVCLGQR